MAKRLAFERYLWFHARLKKNRFPKLRDLADKFEISMRQAAREIEFMRDFFSAPIVYSNEESGYYYDNNNFELPGIWISEEEIISLIISKRLASSIPDRSLKDSIHSFFQKIYQQIDFDLARLEEKISLKNIQYYRVNPEIFQTVLFALNKDQKVKICYKSGYSGRTSQRIIHPLHLLLYMGNWHLLAYCEMKSGLRDFVLSRLTEVELTGQGIPEREDEQNIKDLIEQNYGIFFHGESRQVTLKFSSSVAGMIKDQIWYPGQILKTSADGSLQLTIPVTDFREISKDILKFGPDVEVLQPADLRRQIRATIAEMLEKYRN